MRLMMLKQIMKYCLYRGVLNKNIWSCGWFYHMIIGYVVGLRIRKSWSYCWSGLGGMIWKNIDHVVGLGFLVGRVRVV